MLYNLFIGVIVQVSLQTDTGKSFSQEKQSTPI
jgi:hypothetical protein